MMRDNRPAVTPSVPGRSCDQQFRVTPTTEITHYTCTCIFPGDRIAVIHVIGAQSQWEAREACRAAWGPRRYTVEDGDPTNGHAEPFYLRLDSQQPKPLFIQRPNGSILTTCFFLDEEWPIELHLENGILSDGARAYSVVSMQVICGSFRPGWTSEVASEISKALDVQYHEGVFALSGVTEENLELSILRLVNALLLFYGVMIGASRMKDNEAHFYETPIPRRAAGKPLKPYRTIDDGDED